MTENLIAFLGQKPLVGALTSFTGFVGSISLIGILQGLALTASLVVSILTIVGWFKNQKNKK